MTFKVRFGSSKHGPFSLTNRPSALRKKTSIRPFELQELRTAGRLTPGYGNRFAGKFKKNFGVNMGGNRPI
ncbi:MAG: hypothetical protein ABSE16_18320 [Verrucomicrobiota bacterium]|jgi:hypothetical protein